MLLHPTVAAPLHFSAPPARPCPSLSLAAVADRAEGAHVLAADGLAQACADIKAWALRSCPAEDGDVAATVTAVVVQAYWREVARPTLLRPPFRAADPLLDPTGLSLAAAVARAAAGVGAEVAGAALGLLYTSLLPRAVRRAGGVYYTPPALADLALRRAEEAGADWSACTVLEPACGSGALLLPVLGRMLAAMGDRGPEVVVAAVGARLRGTDLDPHAAWLCQVLVDAMLLPWTRACGTPAPRVIHVQDGLEPDPAGEPYAPDLIIGNPPYGCIGLDATRRARFARSVRGRANLASLFLDHALSTVRPGGVVAFLMPASPLGGEYGSALRCLIAAEAPPVSLDLVSERAGVYDGALQGTMLLTLRRGGSAKSFAVAQASIAEGEAHIQPLGPAELPADPAEPWIVPRSAQQARLAPALRRAQHRLADYGYRVRTGPLDGSRVREPATDQPRVPLLWAEAVAADELLWPTAKPRRSAWVGSNGRGELLVRSPCVLLKRTTAPEQPRRLVAATLPAEFLLRHGPVAIENHLNVLEPTRADTIPPAVLAALLNSQAADDAYRCLSGSVAVSAYELRALLLPDPARLAGLARLVAARAGQEAIEAECRRLYGAGGSTVPAALRRPRAPPHRVERRISGIPAGEAVGGATISGRFRLRPD